MRVVRRRPAAVLAATVLAMGALSACGGEGEGGSSSSSTTATPRSVESSSTSSSSSTSATSSPSSSSGADAPELPEAATKHTQDGAVAFAKYYWSESSRAAHKGDTSTLEELYEGQCAPCQAYVDLVKKDIKKGIRADSSPTTIKETKVTDDANGMADQAVTLTATDAAHEYVDASGDPVGKVEQLDYRVIIYVDWKGGEWTVVDSYMIT